MKLSNEFFLTLFKNKRYHLFFNSIIYQFSDGAIIIMSDKKIITLNE